MWLYWFLFGLTAWMTLNNIQKKTLSGTILSRRWSLAWTACFITLAFAIGLRQEVGADWFYYQYAFDLALGETIENNLVVTDPAYALLSWVGGNIWGGIYIVNFACALFFSWGLVVFCHTQPRPWLALLIAVPYLVTVVAMGYTRQGVAIGIAMMGISALMGGGVFRFVLWVALAATFHKSAIILLPLAVFSKSKYPLLTIISVLFFTVLLFGLLLQESIDHLYQGYIVAEYESSGAAVRVAMNALPAAFFMLYRKKFLLKDVEKKFWTAISLCGLIFVILLVISPSSTAVDRLSLYWIPLQLFVWSRLPDVLGQNTASIRLLVLMVVIYCFFVHFVWLNFSPHSEYWIPYKFYLWEWFWS
jgi:hypothetical protein